MEEDKKRLGETIKQRSWEMRELRQITGKKGNSISFSFSEIKQLLADLEHTGNVDEKLLVCTGYRENKHLTIRQILNKSICEIGCAMGESPHSNPKSDSDEYDRLEKIINCM